MSINWKVRLRNKTFWVVFIPAAVTLIYQACNLLGIVPKFEQQQVVNSVLTVVNGLALMGIIVDPTTKGVSDSEQALEYEEPKDDDIPME
jgi:phi LC3 family holin